MKFFHKSRQQGTGERLDRIAALDELFAQNRMFIDANLIEYLRLRPRAIDVEFRVVQEPKELPWSEKDGTWIAPEGLNTTTGHGT